eukprot:392802-Amorphochlora_amoeboformis.AAC.2
MTFFTINSSYYMYILTYSERWPIISGPSGCGASGAMIERIRWRQFRVFSLLRTKINNRPCDDSKGTHVRSKRQRISRASAPHELKAKMDICTAKEEPQQSIPYATMVESKLLGEMATVMAIQINDDLLKSGDVARAPKDTTASDPLRKEPSRTPSASTVVIPRSFSHIFPRSGDSDPKMCSYFLRRSIVETTP